MKSTFTILAGAVAGLAAGMLGVLLTTDDGPRAQPAATEPLLPAETTSEATEALAGELAALTDEIENLRARIAWLEEAAANPRQPVDTSPEPLAQADEELTELATALATPGRPLPENLKVGVEQVLQDVRQAERAERDARRAEVIEERTEERLTELVDELGLTPVQTEQMRTHLASYSTKRNEIFETARESGDFFNVRESMRDLRRESDEALALILDPTQLDRYEELDDNRGDRDRRGRRRDGDETRR